MLETWLRESVVRLPALVMLETLPRESGVPRLRNFFVQLIFFVTNYHDSFVDTGNVPFWFPGNKAWALTKLRLSWRRHVFT